MVGTPIRFVHGMFMTSSCWGGWVERFRSRGRDVVALPWPHRDAPVEQLRRQHPDPDLARIGYHDVVAHLAEAVKSMADPPILVGHSMGGLMVQALLQRGLGRAGVVLDSAPPRGVFAAKFSFLRANWPVVNPMLPSDRPYAMPFRRFQYAFVNGMPLPVQRAAFDSQVVPESLRIPRESRTRAAAIDFSRDHAPLLLVAGSADHIIPSRLNQKNYARYRKGSGSVVEYREFSGRNHYGVLAGPGWEEVADFAIDWADAQGARAP